MDYWVRFMNRFPTVEALAKATEDEVLLLWQGLGYYSRARNLHHAAKQIVQLGHFPNTHETISTLKGVGTYTAAAIASIAFNIPVAVVDGNVYRVLARFFGIDTPINSTEGKKQFAALAQSLLPQHDPARYNEAIMDFGALQCLPVKGETRKLNNKTGKANKCNHVSDLAPAFCNSCPLNSQCVAFAQGLVRSLPVKTKLVSPKQRQMGYLYIRCGGEVAIRKRPAGDIWQGLWEPLLFQDEVIEDNKGEKKHSKRAKNSAKQFPSSQLLTYLDLLAKGQLDNPSAPSSPSKRGIQNATLPTIIGNFAFKHVLTHRIIKAQFVVMETVVKPSLPAEYIWVAENSLSHYAIPRLFELFLEKLNEPIKT